MIRAVVDTSSRGARVILSGDRDLLALNPFDAIPIVPPDRFLAMFEVK
jgi:predicted nucleic acid-binding protein